MTLSFVHCRCSQWRVCGYDAGGFNVLQAQKQELTGLFVIGGNLFVCGMEADRRHSGTSSGIL